MLHLPRPAVQGFHPALMFLPLDFPGWFGKGDRPWSFCCPRFVPCLHPRAAGSPGETRALHQDQISVRSPSNFTLTEGCLREKAEPAHPPLPALSPLGPGRDFHPRDATATLPRTAGLRGQLPAAGTDAPAPGACTGGARDCRDGRSWHKLLYGDPRGR